MKLEKNIKEMTIYELVVKEAELKNTTDEGEFTILQAIRTELRHRGRTG